MLFGAICSFSADEGYLFILNILVKICLINFGGCTTTIFMFAPTFRGLLAFACYSICLIELVG